MDRRRALWTVWGLAAIGVVLSGFQQYLTYRSDRDRDTRQAAMQNKAEADQKLLQASLNTSLQRQEYVRGQLDSIALMVSKFGERSPDLRPLAGAIQHIADTSHSDTLKANIVSLIKDMKAFLSERKRVSVGGGFGTSTFGSTPFGGRSAGEYDRQTLLLFRSRFDARLQQVSAELARRGLGDEEMERFVARPSEAASPDYLDRIIDKLISRAGLLS
jgi:hypothetical protein